jgi:predicted RNA-binding Zn-ribbon protein involved in translation (DUF1610 family)
MQRGVQCPDCGRRFAQELPDVTAEEVARLKAAGDDSQVVFPCPQCKKKISVRKSSLLDPPAPP